MGDFGATAELEAELIKRNREIARARDDVQKVERRLEDAQLRNDELLEKNAELDAECTRFKQRAKDVEEKVAALEEQLSSHGDNADSIRKMYEDKLEAAVAEAKAASQREKEARDDEGKKALEATVEEIQGERRRLVKDLETERSMHMEAKATLQQCEGSLRESSGRSGEQKRRIAELEEELQHSQTTTKQEAEGRVNSLIMRNNQLEHDLRKSNHNVSEVDGRLEAQRHTIDELGKTLSEIQMERDNLREEKGSMEQTLRQEMGSRDEVKAGYQGAMDEVRDRLEGTVRLKDELQEQVARLEKEVAEKGSSAQESEEKALAAEEKAKEKVQALTVRNAQIEGQLRSRQQELLETNGRLDAQNQYLEQVGEMINQLRGDRDALMETKGSLEAQLKLERESTGATHQQLLDDMSKRCKELEDKMMSDREAHREALDETRNAHAEQKSSLEADLRSAKEKAEAHEKSLVTMREDLEEKASTHLADARQARKEIESLTAFYRDEAEKLQNQVSEAHGEKEVYLNKTRELEVQHGDAKAELQVRIEASDAKGRQLEADLAQLRTNHEEANARERDLQDRKECVEKELKSTSERLMEVEGRCDEQRRYLEQVQENVKQLQADRDTLTEAKGSLEAQVKVEQATRETYVATQGVALEESTKRCRELEDRLMHDRDSHREAVDELRHSSSERVAAIELELRMKQERHETLEKSLADTREELEGKVLNREMQSQQNEQQMQALLNSHKEEAEKLKGEVADTQAQKEAHSKRADDLESQKREAEAKHRDHVTTAEAQQKELQAEVSRVKVEHEETKGDLSRQLDETSARVKGLEERLRQEVESVESAQMAKATAQAELHRKDVGCQQTNEMLAMAAEELRTRQSDFALEKRRLTGALEESRRTLRNSLGVMSTQPSAVNTARVASLEAQLSEAKRKCIEKEDSAQRAQERLDEMSGLQGRHDDDRTREVEQRCRVLDAELSKARSVQAVDNEVSKQAGESAAMAQEEMLTVRYEARCDSAKLRGALDQLRFMLKMQGLPTGSLNSGAATPMSRPSTSTFSLDNLSQTLPMKMPQF